MEENNRVIKMQMKSHEECLVTRFPYTLLIRCWSLMRRAEEDFFHFNEEYEEYASNPVNCTVDVHYYEIPLTEDRRYLLNLYVQDCMVRSFSIIQPPQN